MNFTKNQLILQTLLANNLVPKRNIVFVTSIANTKSPSSKQLYWVDKLADEITNKPASNPDPEFDISKLFTLFKNAQKHLKYPKVTLQLADGSPLRLQYNSKHDAVFVSRGGFNSEQYCRINSNGDIVWYAKDQAKRNAVLIMIKAFAADPEKVAADYGKLTHNCCYCSKQLDTPESLAVGYGPRCAQHFDLKWGKTAPRTKPNVKELVNDEVIDLTPVFTAAAALDQARNELLDDW